jgi:hypothetical protein
MFLLSFLLNTAFSQHSRSSVAILAVPHLVDVAQFFIILSTALALGCVLMGFNTGVDEKLSQIQRIPALQHKFQ